MNKLKSIKKCPKCRYTMLLKKVVGENAIETKKYFYLCSNCGTRTREVEDK